MIVSALKKLIQAYHWLISPWLGNRCRFVPTCSEYAQQALDQHGAARGTMLVIKRLLRCHPWGGEGFDPVPCGQQSAQYDNSQNDKTKVGSSDDQTRAD